MQILERPVLPIRQDDDHEPVSGRASWWRLATLRIDMQLERLRR